MHVAVIGAGISGVSSALALARAGHRVEVFEQHGSIAAGASFADAGLMLPIALQALVRPRRGWRKLTAWLGGPKATVTASQQAQRDTQRLLALASASLLQELTPALHLDHAHSQGWTLLLRTEKELKALAPDLSQLASAGIAHSLLDASQIRQFEPALNPEAPLHAALHLPGAPVVNTRQLSQQLRMAAQRAGARFHLDSSVQRITPGQPVQLHWQRSNPPPRAAASDGDTRPELPPEIGTPSGSGRFDAVLLCGGLGSTGLLRELGLKLPLRAAGGCSLTAPMSLPEAMPDPGPRSALTDAQQQITLTRLGDRVRATAMWSEPDARQQAETETVERLYAALDLWFPGAAKHGHHPVWQASRVAPADGAPVLGASGLPGLWLNLGHPDHGTALAMGAASALTTMISGGTPLIDCSALSPQRWR